MIDAELEQRLKESIKNNISEKIDDEINKKVNEFRTQLLSRKDEYISEVMKGIRVYHERDARSLGVTYRILFENIYKIDKNNNI